MHFKRVTTLIIYQNSPYGALTLPKYSISHWLYFSRYTVIVVAVAAEQVYVIDLPVWRHVDVWRNLSQLL